MKKTRHIALGVTGSIAAYKAAELVRMIRRKKWEVSVIMTRAAAHFAGELTFRTLSCNPVMVELFDEVEKWEPAHVSLADRVDALLIAPCTANVIAKLAHGIADDSLTATALACEAPLVIAPAMNEKMWRHPATRENVALLKARGAVVVDVGQGDLACGTVGQGRLAELATIMDALEEALCAD